MIAAMTLMLLILAVFTVTLVSWVLLDLYDQLVARPRLSPAPPVPSDTADRFGGRHPGYPV